MIYYKSWLFIEKTSDDVTKLNLWNYGIGWHIQKEQKASANREPKISLLVQTGYKNKQRYVRMTPYKASK